jgi:hypothetical protein
LSALINRIAVGGEFTGVEVAVGVDEMRQGHGVDNRTSSCPQIPL